MWAREELVAWEEIEPLIMGIRLVLREACNRAQRATVQVRAYLFVGSACHSPHVYKYIILCAFFLFCRSKINHMSEYEHAFIL